QNRGDENKIIQPVHENRRVNRERSITSTAKSESARLYALRQERVSALLSRAFIFPTTTYSRISDMLPEHRPATAETRKSWYNQKNLCPTSQPADRHRVVFPLDRCTTGSVSRRDPTC